MCLYNYTNIIVGARGTFYYPLVNKLDTYPGAVIGYNIVTSSTFGTFGGTYTYSPESGGLLQTVLWVADTIFLKKILFLENLGMKFLILQ